MLQPLLHVAAVARISHACLMLWLLLCCPDEVQAVMLRREVNAAMTAWHPLARRPHKLPAPTLLVASITVMFQVNLRPLSHEVL